MRTMGVIFGETFSASRGVLLFREPQDLLRLLQASFEEKLAREAAFEVAAGAVLTKNAELYRRLA